MFHEQNRYESCSNGAHKWYTGVICNTTSGQIFWSTCFWLSIAHMSLFTFLSSHGYKKGQYRHLISEYYKLCALQAFDMFVYCGSFLTEIIGRTLTMCTYCSDSCCLFDFDMNPCVTLGWDFISQFSMHLFSFTLLLCRRLSKHLLLYNTVQLLVYVVKSVFIKRDL